MLVVARDQRLGDQPGEQIEDLLFSDPVVGQRVLGGVDVEPHQ